MAGKGRYSQSNEWDSRDDCNSSVYDPQYPDDDSGRDVTLDHCRLYIKNIPKALNEEGLRAAFSKFGKLCEVYLSRDSSKHYALVRFDTPGEAKQAMMKMNRTEPLNLFIYIAHKKKSHQNRDWQDRNTSGRGRSDKSFGMSNRDREETASVVSRGRTSRLQDENPNGDKNMDELLMEGDYGFSDILDPNLHLELENLKLEQLKVREEQLQCKQRVILLKQAERKPIAQMSNRCIRPDGKIVVRNTNESRDSRDADVSFSAGAGDSLNLPGLQRVAARQCVVCGNPSDAFCAGCGITPYCSERCQRRDWHDRHSAVCHNLARMNKNELADNEPSLQPVLPLRQPHGNTPNNKREYQNKEDSTDGRNSTGGFNSKASVKSTGSSGKEDRYNNSRQPFPQRNFNQQKEDEPVKAVKPVSPKKEVPVNRTFAPAKKLEVAVEPKKTELMKPAVIIAKQMNMVPKTAAPVPTTPEEATPPPKVVTPAVQPASVSDVTPTRRMLPKNYLLEKMSVGDSFIMSVDAKAADCRITCGDYVCLTMGEPFEQDYHLLCEDLVLDCNTDSQPARLIPGETISYFNPEDCGWYRARCLNPTTLALLDSGKVVTVTAADKCRKLPSKYEAIPEFCAVLACKGVEIGASFNCKILSQASDRYKISMTNIETNASAGEGEVFRWLPTVEYQVAPSAIPDIDRPPLTDGSKVLLVLADSLDKVYVRPADAESQRKYNDILQQVLLSAMKAKPLTEPPTPGDTVIGKFTDGCHYRALVRRVKVSQNRYQIEYAEYGNIEVSTLEDLYPCPADLNLSSVKTEVAMLKLAPATELSTAAKDFIKELMLDEELVLTLPDGLKTAPSGSEASLTVTRNRASVGAKLVEMCTPDWKKIEQRGGDVVEMDHVMFQDVKYAMLPKDGCTIAVLDVSVLKGGAISGYDRADPNAEIVFKQLTAKLAAYCNSELGRDPYLPKPEELCIAKSPSNNEWLRAVFVDLVSGPGSSQAKVCYLDYGNIGNVPVSSLRKMMPEFITGIPVMGLYMDIRDFPPQASKEMLDRALAHIDTDAKGRGTLMVRNCEKQSDGIYLVDAPNLLAAMKG